MVDIPTNRAAAKGTDWEHVFDTPHHWPDEVHRLTIENMESLGRHTRTNELYWNGEPLVTERRFATQERVIAWLGLALALVGVAATVAQAWAAWLSIPHA